jgi:signal peptidase I
MVDDKPQAAASKKEKPGSLLRTLLGLALFAWVLRSLVVAPFSIPSGSMLPGLYIGDYLLVAKWPYGYGRASFLFGFPPIDGRILGRLPERGEVVVFRGPQGADVIKRVIGLPGDTVATRGGQLVLNGKPVPRTPTGNHAMPVSANSPCRTVGPVQSQSAAAGQCLYPSFRETLPNGRSYTILEQVDNPAADEFGPVQVPAGMLFLMGDNRDDSADSRYPPALGGMGFVPAEALVGRAWVTFWSTDGSSSWLLPWTWFTALRPERIGDGH